MNCQLCDKKIKVIVRLYDKNRKPFGDYCSRECAESDAWGPIFREYRIRKLPNAKPLNFEES